MDSVKTLMTSSFEGKIEETRNSCVVTADREYRKESFLEVMASFDLASIFIIPGHIHRAHPFVADSALNPHRAEEEEEDASGSDNENRTSRR